MIYLTFTTLIIYSFTQLIPLHLYVIPYPLLIHNSFTFIYFEFIEPSRGQKIEQNLFKLCGALSDWLFSSTPRYVGNELPFLFEGSFMLKRIVRNQFYFFFKAQNFCKVRLRLCEADEHDYGRKWHTLNAHCSMLAGWSSRGHGISFERFTLEYLVGVSYSTRVVKHETSFNPTAKASTRYTYETSRKHSLRSPSMNKCILLMGIINWITPQMM